MRFNRNIPVLLILFTALLFTDIGHSQNMLQGEPSQEIRETAEERVNAWTNELALTSKQADLMENKIIEFSMKRDEILNSKMREEAKTERLERLQVLENKDMRDILTKPQYERYLALQRERAGTQEEEENKGRNESEN